MNAALSVESVGVGFGGVRVLDGVNLTVEPGEIRGLIGPNGASRTIRAGVVFAGQAADECQFHVAVPRPREENSR